MAWAAGEPLAAIGGEPGGGHSHKWVTVATISAGSIASAHSLENRGEHENSRTKKNIDQQAKIAPFVIPYPFPALSSSSPPWP